MRVRIARFPLTWKELMALSVLDFVDSTLVKLSKIILFLVCQVPTDESTLHRAHSYVGRTDQLVETVNELGSIGNVEIKRLKDRFRHWQALSLSSKSHNLTMLIIFHARGWAVH